MHVMKSSRILAVLVAATLSACGGSAKKTADTGDLTISIAAVTGGPQVVLVRIYGPTVAQVGVPPTIDEVIAAQLVTGSGVFRASFPSIPAGTYQIHARGYDAFDVLPADYNNPAVPFIWDSASSDPSITVIGGQQASGNLAMQEVGVLTYSNSAPWVSLLSSSTATVVSATNGGAATSATLGASLVDADGDLTDFTWSSDVGGTFSVPAGTFSPPVGAQAISTLWTPPPNYAGPAVIFLEIFDSAFNASRVSMTLNVVQSAGFGSVVVDVTYNNNPMIVTPLVANYMPDGSGGGQIPAGGTTLLSVSAFDPNGDTLSFGYTDDCGGSFANQAVVGAGTSADPALSTVEYTVPVSATIPATGYCTATVDILDGNGGELIMTLGLHIGLPVVSIP